MNFIKRAWNNVSRRFTKTILLAVTFFMIGNLVILGLGISQAAENAKILTRKKMKAVVNYEIDYESFHKYVDGLTDQTEIDEAYKNYPKLDKENASALLNDERVIAYNYIRYSNMFTKDISGVPVGNEHLKENNGSGSYILEDGTEVEYREPELQVYGNMSPNMIEFADGTNTIVEGRFYNQSDLDNQNRVVVISKELAEHNNLKIGDFISTIAADPRYLETSTKNELKADTYFHDYEIIGIYTTLNEVDPNSENFRWMSIYENPKNIVYVPMTSYAQDTFEVESAIYEYQKNNNSEFYVSDHVPSYEDNLTPYKVVILIDDPLHIDSYVKYYSDGLAEYTKINANNETFKSLAKPLDTLSFFSNVIVWIVGVNAVVIITLVTALTLKTREFEIGVLLSLGVSKLKIVLQLFTELLLVALIGFTLAIISGSLVAGKVGDEVLKFQQSQQEEENSEPWYHTSYKDPTDYFTNISQEELFEEYKVAVSPLLIAEIYVFGLGVVFIAILIPSAMIMRLNPKQILLSTN